MGARAQLGFRLNLIHTSMAGLSLRKPSSQKKRIEILDLAETEGALKPDSRAFDVRYLFNWDH